MQVLSKVFYSLFVGTIRLIPLGWSAAIFETLFRLISYRKSIIIDNLKDRYYGDVSKDLLIKTYNLCLKNITKIGIETLRPIPNDYIQNKEKGIYFENINSLEQIANNNNGVILFVSHYGNWELACATLPYVTTLPVYGVYKPLKNKYIDKKIKDIRSQFGLQLVPLNKIARIVATNNQ